MAIVLDNAATTLDPEIARRAEERFRIDEVRRSRPGWRGRLQLLWLLVGPGILVMLGDNDAGGIITYAQTGAKFGLAFFPLFLLLLIPVAYVVQEMAVRLGAVTGRGHAELIFDRFGPFWGWFSLVDLGIGNLLTLVTEFIGMGAGLAYFGVPLALGVPLSAALVLALAMTGSYWTGERLVLGLSAFNLVFIPAALLVKPDPAALLAAFGSFHLPGGVSGQALFLIIANVGTTIAPWMLFFHQSAVVDKGLTEAELGHGRLDTFLGSVLMGIVAIAVVVLTGLTLFPAGVDVSGLGQADFAGHVAPYLGPVAGRLFALGLFEAGLVAAVTINLSTSWACGEVFGWRHSLNARLGDAPWFYGIYAACVIIAAAVVLIPGAPLDTIALSVQVIATLLMPPALLLMLLLLNDRELMGARVNGRLTNAVAVTIVLALLALNTAYALTVLFPGFLG